VKNIWLVKFFTTICFLVFYPTQYLSAEVLLRDNFDDGVADGWTVVDNGTNNAPSNWSVVSGVYKETSNIWGTASGVDWLKDDKFYGTYSYRGNSSWNDYVLRARLKSDDDGQVGLMFRYEDDGNYYRFFIDNQRVVRRLEKRVGGVFTVLAEDFVSYEIGRWYDVRVDIDDVEIFNVTDTSFSSGMIALYCWRNTGANFDDVEVDSSFLQFSDVTDSNIRGVQQGGHGAAWADIDSDGDPEVYVTANYFLQEMPDMLFISSSGQEFSEEAALRGVDDIDDGTHGAVWADLDNDGDYDLWNGAYTINNLYVNDGTGQFADVTFQGGINKPDGKTRGVVAFDMDNDGDLDLFANNWGSEIGQENELYRNEGNMTFSPVSGGDLTLAIGSQGATGGDLDGDGDVDIILADYFGDHNVFVLLNDSNGIFSLQDNALLGLPMSGNCDGVTLGDLNNDGYLDLIIADSATKFVYVNNGNGAFSFTASFSAPGYMAAVADFDNDGDLDFYCPGDDRIFLNNGSANFDAVSNLGLPNTSSIDPRCASLSDIDDDGDLDIINIHKSGYNVLLRNDSIFSNYSIKVKLKRQSGQIGAFGTKIYIYESGHVGDANYLIALQEVSSQQGYLAQNEPVLHFGVGQRQFVDIRVIFPGGAVQDLVGFPTGTTVSVMENETPDTIQGGIDAAKDGDTVLVADGTYTGEGNKNLDFGGKAIIVRSENGPDNCIIDCEDDGRGFYFHNGEGADSVVSGFTITHGYTPEGGGGMRIEECSPTIENCMFSENQAGWGGGLSNYNSSPTVINCTFDNNSAASGGGMHNRESSPTITNCTFFENNANNGGGITNYLTYASIITNCILWGDTATSGPEIYDINSDTIVTYCDIDQDGYAGTNGNIRVDPRFVDPTNGDYHLRPDCPCIDAGTNDAPELPDTDFKGALRIIDGDGDGIATVDIGADEYPGVPVGGFTADPLLGPAPLTVNFADESTGIIDTWSWDFGDNSTSTAQNPSHTYNDPGTYTVSLTITDPGGSDTETKTDYITACKSFNDVPPGHWAEEAIYKIFFAGITKGCSQNPLLFCPGATVTRAQMAVFLGRGTHGSGFTPPPAIGIFADVDLSHWAGDWIEQAYHDGITKGCSTNPLRYCPEVNVTRAQMAVFLLRAKHGDSYPPPPATGIFADVDLSHWAADWIEQLYEEGITKGCATNPLRYCPETSVTRAQMAVFLVRTFDL